MLLDKEIVECENEYVKCFCSSYENENIIRYRDDLLKDMYYHNYTYIKQSFDALKIKQIIQEEIDLRIIENSHFCNIVLSTIVSDSLLNMFDKQPRISNNGYYSFDLSLFSKIATVPNCVVRKVETQKMIEEILYCDLQLDEATLGKDFCTRRCYRKGKVYLSNKNVDSYLCYVDMKPVGNCDLFISNGVAKIEDFIIIPSSQRKGYGTTLLKTLIGIAIKEGCHTIYLVADEDDTPKQMYLKLGFKKIGEKSDLFFEI
jgi:spore maturation protein CgeE